MLAKRFSAISLLSLDCIAYLDMLSMIEIKMRDDNFITYILQQFRKLHRYALNYATAKILIINGIHIKTNELIIR